MKKYSHVILLSLTSAAAALLLATWLEASGVLPQPAPPSSPAAQASIR